MAKKSSTSDLAIGIFCFGIPVAIVLFLVAVQCQPTENYPRRPVELPGSVRASRMPTELQDHLQLLCIEGHAYFFAKWSEGHGSYSTGFSVLSPKLEEDGRPSPCVTEERENAYPPSGR